MKHPEIALVVDSCTDVPSEFIAEHGIYVVPLIVNYDDKTYLDRIDIQPQDVYDRMPEEIPTTSTPTPAGTAEVFQRVVDDGYEKAVVVTISSGLSSTFDVLRSAAVGTPGLQSVIIDSKSIGLGAGLVAIGAQRLLDAGVPFEQMEGLLEQLVRDSRVYFCVDTLEYLYKGGRIGKVLYKAGSMLNMRPVISCNEEGVYYTVSKARGRKQSLTKAINVAMKFASNFEHVRLGAAEGDAHEEMQQVAERLRELRPDFADFWTGQISPVLVVHTGPGLVGVAVSGLRVPELV